LAHITTLEEIETHWSICDLADAHEALDIQQEADEFYRKQAERNAKVKG